MSKLILLFLLILACGRTPKSYINGDASKFFLIQPNNQERMNKVLWYNDDFRIGLQSSSMIQEIRKIYTGNLVMVTYKKQSILEAHLKTADQTLLWKDHNHLDHGSALIHITDPEELNFIAHQAHDVQGFACGNVELLLNQVTNINAGESFHPPSIPTQVKIDEIKELMNLADLTKIQTTIKELVNLNTRYHNTESGLDTPQLIKEKIESHLSGYGSVVLYEKDKVDVTSQASVIARFEGQSKPEEIVILGAHLDSINHSNQSDAPGADDNATGISLLIEMSRLIGENKITFDRTVELHAYGAEEIGLVGSQLIANEYAEQNKKVVAMFQLDMMAWSKDAKNDSIYLISTDTNESLTGEFENLLNTYLDGNYRVVPLAFGTSDHKSWTKAGFAAAFAHENPDSNNPMIHTSQDTYENLNNFSLIHRFAKLSFTYLAHYGGYPSINEIDSKLIYDAYDHNLKVAVLDDKDFYIATPQNIDKVEVCIMANLSDLKCAEKAITPIFHINENGKKYFFDKGNLIPWQEENPILINAYEKDRLVDQRSLRFSRTNN